MQIVIFKTTAASPISLSSATCVFFSTPEVFFSYQLQSRRTWNEKPTPEIWRQLNELITPISKPCVMGIIYASRAVGVADFVYFRLVLSL